jgi:hypothetical protein
LEDVLFTLSIEIKPYFFSFCGAWTILFGFCYFNLSPGLASIESKCMAATLIPTEFLLLRNGIISSARARENFEWGKFRLHIMLKLQYLVTGRT